jgi:3-deoxy-D-manno-octulosonate 8-phosphate phosphatase (KDO 8-P phosphatase)
MSTAAAPEGAALAQQLERARRVRLMVFDVDGVLTDGRLWYGPEGETLKAFSVLDGLGMKLLAASGVQLAILSARGSAAVARRAAELGIARLVQGAEDKRAALEKMLAEAGLPAGAAGFMGDDLADLAAMRACGFACAPATAADLVLRHAHYVTRAPAGAGAAREACEFVMRAQGTLEAALAAYLA